MHAFEARVPVLERLPPVSLRTGGAEMLHCCRQREDVHAIGSFQEDATCKRPS